MIFNQKIKGNLQNLQILKSKDFLSVILDIPSSNKDAILATCIRDGILDTKQEYSLKILETYSKQTLVLIQQKKLKKTSIPECLLPLCLENKYLQSSMFCFGDILVVFYQGKILSLQKYNDFSDIFSVLLMLKQEKNIEVEMIFSLQKYEMIQERQRLLFEEFGENYLNLWLLESYKQNPSLFFEPSKKFYQHSLFYLGIFFIGLIVLLFICSNILEKKTQTEQLASNNKNLDLAFIPNPIKPYFSRYVLIEKIAKTADSFGVFFKNMEFVSQDNIFSLSFEVCFSSSNIFIDWAQETSKIIKTQNLFYTEFEKKNNFYCTLATWVKE
ncbi:MULTISPECIES: hypothetical protein [unclassified Helicobacter]|uniref:hypothetical protein n=1 Tax=unclassified Helicobacter TaxID=2593540 RepID=UPI000CF03EFF|nr:MULTISPECIES: hypothetical protein [unclassified Helicobacter]